MRHFFLILLIICTVSCGKTSRPMVQNESNAYLEVPQKALVMDYSINNNHQISDTRVSYILEDRFPEKEVVKQETLLYKSNNLLHIINFDNGWAIIAGDDRAESVVLAFSDEGYFDYMRINSPELAFWFELIKASIQEIIDKDEEIVKSYDAMTKSEEPYYWIRIPLGETTTINDGGFVSPLTETKWGQESPWNIKCPIHENERFPAGCVAVATAQILYYLVKEKNYQIGLYHQIIPTYTLNTNNPSGAFYYISSMVRGQFNKPSSRWEDMPLTKTGLNTAYVADLLVDIGDVVGMRYTPDCSDAVFMDEAFGYYGVGSTSSAYYFSVVKESLDDGYPVMVSAYKTQYYNEGHAWIIDGYKDYETITEKRYRWYMASSDSLSYYNYDLCYSEAQKQQLAPEVNEEDVFYEYAYYRNKYLNMNWGWDGDENGNGSPEIGRLAFFIFPESTWPSNVNGYNYYPFIVASFYEITEPEYN